MGYASFVAIWEVESEVYNKNLISLESILHIIIIIIFIFIFIFFLLTWDRYYGVCPKIYGTVTKFPDFRVVLCVA